MRIKENIYDQCESYFYKHQERVVKVFQYISQIKELKKLLDEIKKDIPSLGELFWTEKELQEKDEVVNLFHTRMQATVYYTLKNIESYQQYGWKELIYEGENDDERIESI